jgi:acyl-CoA synthetase (AMP-forming)/AMP-acid ligase II
LLSEGNVQTASTINALLRGAAAADPDRIAYSFLASAGRAQVSLTYGELDRRAGATAARLCRAGIDGAAHGKRQSSAGGPCVLVVFPPGLDFLAAFFGCLYAGAIAIPTRYPNHSLTHLSNIAADSGAKVGLTTPDLQPLLARELSAVTWLTLESLDLDPAQAWDDPGADPDDVAYLQYTSGSTAAPKGVMVCHRHVVTNCRYFSRQLDFSAESRVLTWLPHFHDLGLIFGLIGPLYNRCPSFIMAPMAFAQRPINWLQAVSDHRITHCAAPNFAYQACLSIPASQLDGLDLSTWRVALNGAEPVRADTIEGFTRRFGPYGFSGKAMCPGYGLAEATLVATTCGPELAPVACDVLGKRLPDGVFAPADAAATGTRLIGSGRPDAEMDVVIADPDSSARCAPGRIGEVWLRGASVTAGYWNNPEATRRKFAARLAGEAIPFLRTGDLGVIHDGELFVLGRMDDLIIIRGANYAPEDMEMTIEAADVALSPGGGAVVAVDIAGEPRLVVFHEVERLALRKLDADQVVKSIIRVISERHQLEVSAVVLLKPRGLPRTHSGKKQRHACRRSVLDGSAEGVHIWIAPALRQDFPGLGLNGQARALPAQPSPERTATTPRASNGKAAASPGGGPSGGDKVADLTAWLRSYAGERLNSHLMDERRTIPPYVVLDLGNRGVLGMQAPQRYGGLGLDNRNFVRVLEQLAAIDLTLGSFVTVNNCLGVRPIMLHATAEKRDELLPILAPGRELAAFAMTEPGAGSNVRAIAAQGRPTAPGAGGSTAPRYGAGRRPGPA